MGVQEHRNLSCPLPAVMVNFPEHTGLSLLCTFPPVANICATESSLEERMEQMCPTCGWLGPARQCYVACRKDDPCA